ncbi:MAG: guanitoxin biosynthesis MBL fold metallo-hydrolase GntH, partial [Gammaproteobacteria bacterium]
PDGVVVNVTKNAIWTRKAALPESTNFARPSKREAIELFGLSPTKTTVDFPDRRYILTDLESGSRDQEYDPKLYYPADVYRKPDPFFPTGFKIDIKKMVMEKIGKKVGDKIEGVKEKLKGLRDKLKNKLDSE